MPKTINVLFLAAEAEPFIKVGGLGDVAGTLPRALRSISNDDIKLDVRLVIPHHPAVKADLKPLGMFSIKRGDSEIQIEASEAILNGMPVYFIGGEPISANGSVYSSNAKLDAEKYIFFSLAALELPRQINWQPDVIHANDWHTAISVYGSLTKRWEGGERHVASVLTLHNLPFMGPDSSSIIESYGLQLAQTDLPDWARVMPLPLGLWASDAIVAVSPTYGNEIMQPEYGCGLNDFFQSRRETVSGILNGLDTVSFNPAEDMALGVNFDSTSLEKRAPNKGTLQSRLGLPVDPEIPLLAMVTRMDVQKGVDLALTALKSMKNIKWQAVILGTGDPKLEEAALDLQAMYPERVKVETRYDAGLARQIYAGSDMLLMPSRYEPCGLSQMIAMRYGCVPIVRAAGGLNDTVQHGETGFVFQKAHHLSLLAAVKSALKVYSDREKWGIMQRAGMAQDFSWENSAKKYLQLYQSIIKS
ncbi:MAG: glycogen synthase [Anaerolineales bacterium]|uniref:glycogen synthase n=1 Tax=Candidatus Villigracilis saccharophilus TaxID=3140684 RepID=UPI0031363913|nr:glycogen synthase [Anaerolineales bacterium]MBK8421871.1 glycogen synthase [Anaerolineales bacterium]